MKKKDFITLILSVVGELLFALGMCMVLVASQTVCGIIVGVVGVVLLLCLIPLCKGWK